MNAQVFGALARTMVDQSRRLGLTWQLATGTVDTQNDVVLDGAEDQSAVTAIPLQGLMVPGDRVMCLLLPADGIVYILGSLGFYPSRGELVAKIRQTTPQTFASTVNEFIDFNTADYDPWGGFQTATPARWTFPFSGIFLIHGSIKWAANATSRRGTWIHLNGSVLSANTMGGQSVQAAAAGTTQVDATGIAIVQAGEYVSLRGLQNSGADLDTTTSDNGSVMEIIYIGQPVVDA